MSIEIIIPSFHIFPLDLTYSLGDTIAEYDALALVNIAGKRKLILLESVSKREKKKEEKKIIRDLKLWGVPVIYFFPEGRFRWPLSIVIKESVNGVLKNVFKKFENIWRKQYELFNLLNYSIVLLHPDYATKIQNDIKKFKKIKNQEIRCLSDIVFKLQGSEEIIRNKSETIGNKSETIKDILKLDSSRTTIIYVFPQLIYSVEGVRQYFPANLTIVILKSIERLLGSIHVRVIGIGRDGKCFSQKTYSTIRQYLNKLPGLKYKTCIIPIISQEEDITKLITKDLKCKFLKEKKLCIIFLIASDYNKQVFIRIVTSIYNILKDKDVEYIFLLIPETLFVVKKYDPSRCFQRLIELKSPFNKDPNRFIKNINTPEFLEQFHRKNILIIEGLDAKKLIETFIHMINS